MKIGLFAICLSLTGCGAGAATVIKDVGIGIQAADCFFQNYTMDISKGMSEGESVASAAITCGLSEAQATGLLAQHKAAMAVEKCGSK